jgi:hypothetical protein
MVNVVKTIIGVFMFVLLLLTAQGCKPGVPSQYIQPNEMEDILYDYHLAGAMARNSMADGKNEYAYRLAALKKHGVDQAEFDSSMVYYMQNTNMLHEIYQRLSKRLESEEMALGGAAANYDRLSSKGDTANVWNGDRSVVLTSQIPYNMYSFAIKADTSFHKGDRYLLEFDVQFIFQEGMRDAVAVLAMTLANDSVVAQTIHISSPSHFTLQLNDSERQGVKRINGYFLLNNEKAFGGMQTTLRLLPIYNIRLIKMRANAPEQPSNQPEHNKIDSAVTIDDPKQWMNESSTLPTR